MTRETVSYAEAKQLFTELRDFRLNATPPVTLTEMEVHLAINAGTISAHERTKGNNVSLPSTLINHATRIIGWAVPLETTVEEYQAPINARKETNRKNNERWRMANPERAAELSRKSSLAHLERH